MKTVILAGGRGTRLSEETALRPKPMVEIGGLPILTHIMHIYAHHGFTDFVVACGYKGEMIREYFAVTPVPWSVQCVDTGAEAMTGGRLAALRSQLADESFMVTYGDGVADVDLGRLVEYHRSHGRAATVTAVHPPPRFGALTIATDDAVTRFDEKSPSGAGWINGGFFVFEPSVLDTIAGPMTKLEAEPLSTLASTGRLKAYRHEGFWRPMDTLRDKHDLEEMWASGRAPWKVW